MQTLKILALALSVSLLAGCICCAPGNAPSFPEGSIEKLCVDHLQPLVRDRHIVGASIGVLRNGQITTLGLGQLRWGSDLAPDADTVYEIGSITKTFTGVLMGLALEDGAAQENTLLKELLPAGVLAPAFNGQEITLAHLATHTSGLPRLPDNLDPADSQNPYADYTAEQLYAFLGSYHLTRAPGSQYEYSNLAAGVLGYVLALRMGLEYEPLITERILAPLGMTDTAITLSESQKTRLAPGYSDFFGIGCLRWPVATKNWDMSILGGAGGLRSTVNDLLKYIQAHLEPPDSALGRALQSAQQQRFAIDGQMFIGLLWHGVNPADGSPRFMAHNGETGGYRSFIGFYPEQKIGLVILSNTAYDFEAEGLGLLRALLEYGP